MTKNNKLIAKGRLKTRLMIGCKHGLFADNSKCIVCLKEELRSNPENIEVTKWHK